VTVVEGTVSGDESRRDPSTGGTIALAFAWVAIFFAILSVPGALIFVPGLDVGLLQLLGNVVSPITAVLSWAAALTATIVALVNVIRRRGNHGVRLALGLAAPGAVLGTAALVAVVVFIGNVLGLWAGNAAETAAKPTVDAYTTSGAERSAKTATVALTRITGNPGSTSILTCLNRSRPHSVRPAHSRRQVSAVQS
jgi:hypothetical protein